MIYIMFAAYNEAWAIPAFLTSIRNAMEEAGYSYLVIASTDASTDETAAIIASYQKEMPIHLIPQIQERGLGVAFRRVLEALYSLSKEDTDIAVFVDADCTCDLSYSKQLIAEIQNGADVVIASRFVKGGGMLALPLYRKTLSYIAAWLFHTLFPITNVREYTCSYRAYALPALRKARQAFPNGVITEKDFSCMAEILIKLNTLGAKFREIPFVLDCTGREGESKMRIGYLIVATLKMCYGLWGLRKLTIKS